MERSNAKTERFFRDSGISEGMSVLELGCGPGEVTEVVANIVGPSGAVVSVDQSEQMIALAEARMESCDIQNVRFRCNDLAAAEYLRGIDHASFDAVAGRRILMYLAEPARVIAGLLPWLRSGGLVVFEEADSTLGPGSATAMPAHAQACAWIDQLLKAEGVDRSMGFHLPATFATAGLHDGRVSAEAVIEGQGDQYPLDALLKLLIPRLESAEIATASATESLIARIEREKDPSSVFVSGMRFCACARKP